MGTACRLTEYICVPDALSSTNEWGCAPRKLIFGETDYSFFSEQPVPACSLKKYCDGMCYAKNRLSGLLAWLAENDCRDVCMESTGKYWIPVYNILEASCKVVLAHPKYVKAIRGKKADKKDAKWIADIFKHDLVSGSFIPPADIRQLRDLVRYRWKLTNFTTGKKNRAQNCLTVSNIKLDVFSDVFGKAANAITSRLLESNEPFDVSDYLTKGIKASTEEIQLAVDGEMCDEQAEKHLPQLELVLTVPGIQSFSAIAIIGEIGVDMSVFPTSKHLCSWAGLTPQNNESAGKKKTTRVSRAGAYINPLLVQCANNAIRKKANPEIRNCYLALKKGRGHKKAIIAICRMLLTAIYNISKRVNPTTQTSIARRISLLPTVKFPWMRPSLSSSVRVT